MMLITIATEEVAELGLFSLMTASLSLFIWETFQKEMIFRRYYLLLVYYWIKWRKKKNRWKRQLLKPIGLCIYCMSTWIAIISYIIFLGFKVDILFFIGINYVVLEILKGVIKNAVHYKTNNDN